MNIGLEMKLTKNELRVQQSRLVELQKYLPTLQLKKSLLQQEVLEARIALQHYQEQYDLLSKKVEGYSTLFEKELSVDLKTLVKALSVEKGKESIAGIEVPYFKSMTFHSVDYGLYETSVWVDTLISEQKKIEQTLVQLEIAKEKTGILENEFREVSTKVNLFEKVLIPKTQKAIRKIKVFIDDQFLAALSQAKVAKKKIENKQRPSLEETDA